MFDIIRQIGKYVTLTTCIIAVANGIIYRTWIAPIPISILCWVGILLWVVGFLGMWIQKRMAARSSRRMRAK